jgi:ACS family pantothenate transporter-like MFS transporter
VYVSFLPSLSYPLFYVSQLTLGVTDTFSAWIPLVWFQQVHQPNVTPGNRAAAVVAGINVIVFMAITALAHREKLQKKRNGGLAPASVTSEPTTPVNENDEKKLPLGDEEDITSKHTQ